MRTYITKPEVANQPSTEQAAATALYKNKFGHLARNPQLCNSCLNKSSIRLRICDNYIFRGGLGRQGKWVEIEGVGSVFRIVNRKRAQHEAEEEGLCGKSDSCSSGSSTDRGR